ncbi:hypothetical protein DICPUDRAFT_75211 [Dictyostelium purpureum]|uniref:Nucleolar protein 16 n=1 Tax=Dictyostelium purpureum TaxID=5786 RepID=F0ZA01_DICPU|nr:uncharacterized protein DICPUDRAFT_75211 [Dictyostelium purpureum]EGC39206.1 hypothetical protein DICPUDRAFT_75211 [Dictyostelium purpureum]|eukprot:XP_003284233.1 hypothetical protein DICPUDRAFT_75211 [Dictyostelium purpureum]
MPRISKKLRKEGSLKKKFKFGHIDDEVMKRWDNSKTTLENFALMGLQYNNKFISENQRALDKLKMEAKPIELTVPEPIKAKERGVNFHQQHYIRPLIIKYKEDYEKMKMDHKLNFYQKTATELEKLAKKFIVLYGHPIYGDVYQQQQEEEQKKLKEEEEKKLKEVEEEKRKQELLNKKQQQKSQPQSKTTTKQPTASKKQTEEPKNTISKKVVKTQTVSKPKTTTVAKKVVKSK